ncbi:putative membrane protein [Halanaeroarchaeum sp. HSR-CO]|uniref:hypothetical protein n=1 Tax=Halanaeroarchaeum sp. HSR-CO TaxID=2866382 RepID=UPI00217DC4F0|nr:hypothetical protein [Halanaeroarchaeum sp. HSR-CO]UWG48841.1 putative membrane protein [Halanaeroarchaeum sp. HSR-CO]
MNWSRSSSTALVLVALLVVSVAPAAAVSVSDEASPSAVEVGEQQDVTYTVSDLYTDYDRWQLSGETELTDVTWTVTTYDQTDAKIEQQQYNSPSFDHEIAADEDVSAVEVRLQGTTPSWSEWQYDPAQNLTLATFAQAQEGGSSSEVATYTARPYTADSQSARTAIDDAKAAIDDAESAGANPDEAESLLNNAISAYENGNFENAGDLASQAQNSANSAAQSANRTDLLLMAGGVVVLLALVAGGIYWYLQQRETYDRLG